MVRFLLQRPVGVLMTFIALMVFSVIVIRSLPVALLPPIDVPQILVKVQYPNASPEAIEQNVLAPIRESMLTMAGLENIESQAGSETGTIRLTFDFGTKMELAYIEANEKIDRLSNSLPQDLPRPQVLRINTNDIPVIRVQVIPKAGIDLAEISLLTENLLKKRLEQLEGVALVDINGKQEKIISVAPDLPVLRALNMTEENLIQAIRFGNEELPGISVEDGQFRFYLRLATRVSSPEDILGLPVRSKDGVTVDLSRVAKVQYETKEPLGFHLFGNQEALVITVHKQATAKMNDLVPQVYAAVDRFRGDYPQVDFDFSQDQSILLKAGISNLQGSLLFGGIFAFAVLFLFMGDYRTPIIIGLSLPISLLISFLVFYAAGISINIISLSGLALGLGMLIDNAIIVLDNIVQKRTEGISLFEACVQGVNEVMSALISSVLTTLAVFVPLVFLSGIAGALFLDQALAVTAILGVSLLVAFIFLPMLYLFFFKGKSQIINHLEGDSKIFIWIKKQYKKLYSPIFSHPKLSMAVFLLLIPVSLLLVKFVNVEGMPKVEKLDAVVTINWNEPIPASVNKSRTLDLLQNLEKTYSKAEADVGVRQFLLFDGEGSIQESNLYFLFEEATSKEAFLSAFRQNLQTQYPRAIVETMDAPNAFDQLFASDMPYFEVRWRDLVGKKPIPVGQMETWLKDFPVKDYSLGLGLQQEPSVVFELDAAKMALYGIAPESLMQKVRQLFGTYTITDIRQFGEITPITLRQDQKQVDELLTSNAVEGKDGQSYPLSQFIRINYQNHYKYVTADKGGLYQSVALESDNPTGHTNTIREWALDKNLGVAFVGQFFKDQETIRELTGILLVAVLLLYFILAAQFENFVQPMIIIFTLPLGIGGVWILLLLTGSSLNIMSAIGMVVMLGIMVNDAILKIDTINRLRQQYAADLDPTIALRKALDVAGEIRLKPILMTSLTTILALLPVIFSGGIGADLQRPLVYAVIGGLTIGTFTALYFVPLAYWFLAKRGR
ncbi:RND multidrug efflux transporter [Mariniradius saccharolyticus AK6]|uniref:RND multidrug efflux transporter n=1 Tax=Mariniradius saccharolyticus AK6 TaxID=1239962 RepID=M7Y1G3_9BACT|nr:efflux RND transporter permease subunit [Mariniradius saccharolyticus]EMS34577.1 RND multidrug efflux transporter [Mariniradius saccharolyticus AK6]